ncbi:serine/threonine-protein phosphatase [Paracrocinitomix mangrovi]|uniref:PP2C family protein-serine/threonine phosphatase n=1 Tax=Paracrocinitomix mangrovi TaxID=2862509 RepID=UPI001C8EC5B3|nr:SpoIIE family protein phosphatase [Paracrocinitomix mangrovi]UKN03732.1 serine/threonine-protein phosphatase [Paracrocinitomix mangrovi]
METIATSSVLKPVSESRLKYLELRAKELEESIQYAGSLQRSILPNEKLFKNAFDDAFVMFKPKDIVSGDFYWIATYGNDVYIAVGDCTGHGVPGAMVNIAGNTILKQIIRQKDVSSPSDIISLLDKELVALFNDNLTVGQTYDGMDIAFCKFNLKTKKASFCGAGRPLVLVRDGQLIEFKKGPSSVGYNDLVVKEFPTIEIELKKGDQFYLFSDGYTDQFGGENIKKFNRRRFRNLLLSLEEMRMEDQKEELELSLENWKGKYEQIDDVCVIGVRV